MSKKHIEKITCPECKHESEFVVWDSINTQLDPEMKAKAKSGEIFKWTCPECGYRARVDFATLYHQMEDNVMIYYVPGNPEEAIPYLKHAFQSMAGENCDAKYIKRVVGSTNQFHEKLLLLDEGLDDRKIELMKLFVSTRIKLQDAGFELVEMLFDKMQDGTRCFALRLKNGKWQHIEFDQALYDNVSKVFREALEKDDDILIDFNWAVSLMQRQKR